MGLYERFLEHFGGSQAAAAHALGVTPQVIQNWKKRGFPAARALAIEEVTAGAIRAHDVLSSSTERAQ